MTEVKKKISDFIADKKLKDLEWRFSSIYLSYLNYL